MAGCGIVSGGDEGEQAERIEYYRGDHEEEDGEEVKCCNVKIKDFTGDDSYFGQSICEYREKFSLE